MRTKQNTDERYFFNCIISQHTKKSPSPPTSDLGKQSYSTRIL